MQTGKEIPGRVLVLPDILQDYELRFRTLAEKTSLGHFQISAGEASRVIAVNRVLAGMLGYGSPDEICGRRTPDLFISTSDFFELQEQLHASGSVTGREIRLRQKDGTEIWVSIQGWLLPSAKEQVIEGFAEDMTEYRVMEQEMQYHETELNRYALALATLNRKLNLLASITRHDILNKLTGLKGYVELLRMDFPEPKVQEFLAVEDTIIKEITDHVQFTKDYQEIGIDVPRWFDLEEVFCSAVSSLSHLGIPYTLDSGNLQVYADPMLKKVFYNLVENSLRHAENLTAIRVRTEVAGDIARIIYEDDGVGVPEEFKEAIFCRQHFKHTGFGLYLSREILGITGLSIRESGTPGKGVRFEITVPPGSFRAGPARP